MPVKGRKRQAVISGLSILSILFLDQFTKTWVSNKLAIGQSIPVIKNIIHMTFVKNTGAAFGLFKNGIFVFIAISLIAVVVIVGLIFKSISKGMFLSRPFFNFGLVLIVSGALGNLIDRLRFGYVIDFIDIRIWPVFNIADSSITIGTVLLLFSFVFEGSTQG